jgi:hypothetical protein
MFRDRKNKLIPKGDYVTADEAVMDEESEIRSRCESVYDVVSQEIIPLPKALKAYNITIEQYIGFLLLQKGRIKVVMDNTLIMSVAKVFLSIMDNSRSNLDARAKTIVENMRELSVAK